MNSDEIKALDQQYVMQTYRRNPLAIDHGKGATLWSPEGKEYIDFTSGIGVCSLGCANEAWANAAGREAHPQGGTPSRHIIHLSMNKFTKNPHKTFDNRGRGQRGHDQDRPQVVL